MIGKKIAQMGEIFLRMELARGETFTNGATPHRGFACTKPSSRADFMKKFV